MFGLPIRAVEKTVESAIHVAEAPFSGAYFGEEERAQSDVVDPSAYTDAVATRPGWMKANRRYETDSVEEEEEEDEEGGIENEIPKYFAVKSNGSNKYLRYINQDGDGLQGFLQYSGDRVVSPYSKFQVESSEISEKLVHIRCCYNNRYWARLSSNSNHIVAVSSHADEDPTNWSCTLFELEYFKDPNCYRFRHVQLNQILKLSTSPKHPNCLMASPDEDEDHLSMLFTLIDYGSIFILPKHVAFKGDNGKYLKCVGHSNLEFSGSDIKDPAVAHEIFPTNDGGIRIKNDKSGRFWIVESGGWIHASSNDTTTNNPNTVFWPVKVENNVVALRSLGNNNNNNNNNKNKLFCKRQNQGLNVGIQTITKEVQIEITELVVSRVIQNIEYRLNDAKVYGKKILSMTKGIAVNKTKETDTITFKFSYEKKSKKNWTSTISAKLGVTTKFTAGFPMVGSGKVEISAEIGSEYSWGESYKDKKVTDVTHAVTVPPMSRVKIGAIMTQACCDVPFSYTQTDTLRSGRKVFHRFHDGVFTGVNSYDFQFQTQDLPLI